MYNQCKESITYSLFRKWIKQFEKVGTISYLNISYCLEDLNAYYNLKDMCSYSQFKRYLRKYRREGKVKEYVRY